MIINRLIKMYGLRHKHIRIEDQQLNLKINIMIQLVRSDMENVSFTHIELFSIVVNNFLTSISLKTNAL